MYFITLLLILANPLLCQNDKSHVIKHSASAYSSVILSLESPWMIAIGTLLTVVLGFNIAMICYVKCNRNEITRVSFNKNRRSGYASVKHIDSEDFSESDANIINVDGI